MMIGKIKDVQRLCVGRFSRDSGNQRGGHLVEYAVANYTVYYEHEIPEENPNPMNLKKTAETL